MNTHIVSQETSVCDDQFYETGRLDDGVEWSRHVWQSGATWRIRVEVWIDPNLIAAQYGGEDEDKEKALAQAQEQLEKLVAHVRGSEFVSWEELMARLAALKTIANLLARSAGVNTQLSDEQVARIEQLNQMTADGLFQPAYTHIDLRRAAGLSPSDMGLLYGWWIAEQMRRDPEGQLKRIVAYIQNRRHED